MKLRGERASSKSRGHGASLAAPFSNAGRAPERRTRAPHPDLETRSFGGRLGAPGTAALTQRGSARRGVRAVTVGVATRNVSTDGDDTLHVRAAARRRAGTSDAGDCAADVRGSAPFLTALRAPSLTRAPAAHTSQRPQGVASAAPR